MRTSFKTTASDIREVKSSACNYKKALANIHQAVRKQKPKGKLDMQLLYSWVHVWVNDEKRMAHNGID